MSNEENKNTENNENLNADSIAISKVEDLNNKKKSDKRDYVIISLIALLTASLFGNAKLLVDNSIAINDENSGFNVLKNTAENQEDSILIQNHKEIERKWLIREADIPFDLTDANRCADFSYEKDGCFLDFDIYQTYISYDPEIRVRKINDGESYTLTVKANLTADGLTRDEIDFFISEEDYNNMLTKREADGETIHKTRYQLYEGDLMREIDIFHDQLDGLAYLETEYESEEAANAEESKSWIVRDVTDDKAYKNQSLYKKGIPEGALD